MKEQYLTDFVYSLGLNKDSFYAMTSDYVSSTSWRKFFSSEVNTLSNKTRKKCWVIKKIFTNLMYKVDSESYDKRGIPRLVKGPFTVHVNGYIYKINVSGNSWRHDAWPALRDLTKSFLDSELLTHSNGEFDWDELYTSFGGYKDFA